MCDAGVTNISLICTMSDQSNYIKKQRFMDRCDSLMIFLDIKKSASNLLPLAGDP